jgi:hypothetical protein
MDAALAAVDAFEGEMIVVAIVKGAELGTGTENAFHDIGGTEGEEAAVFASPGAGDLNIGGVVVAIGGIQWEAHDAAVETTGPGEEVMMDALAEMTGAGVDHEPERIVVGVILALKLEEVVAGAQGAELEAAIVGMLAGFKGLGRKPHGGELGREGMGEAAMMAARGASLAQKAK